MRLAPILALLAAVPPLLAQTMTVSPAWQPGAQDLKDLLRSASFRGTAVVLGKGTPLYRPFRGVLNQHPRLVAHGLDVLELPDPGKACEELRLREGWEAGPRWAVLDRAGRVVASGTEVPKPAELAQKLEAAGMPTWTEMLETFLKAHPAHATARARLLQRRLVAGMVDLRPRLDFPRPEPGQPNQPPRLKAPLTEAEDQAIHGPWLADFEAFMNTGAWKARGAFWAERTNPTWMQFSTLAKPRLRALLPLIEGELQRAPSHPQLWAFWMSVADGAGELERLPALLAGLQAAPTLKGRTQPFPPTAVCQQLATRLGERQDWAGVVKHLAPAWEHQMATETTVVGDARLRTEFLEGPWHELGRPLAQAYLKLGNVPAATKVVEEGTAWSRSKRYPELAAELARALEQPALADRWAALSVPEGPARPEAAAARKAGQGGAFWLVQEDAKGSVMAALQAALRAQGSQALQIPVESAKGPLAELASAHLQGTGWLLVDAQGKVLASDQRPATPALLKAAADQAGLQAPIPRLEAFLRQHPGHADGLGQLAALRLEEAMAQLKPRLAPGPKDQGPQLEGVVRALDKPLTDAEDARIFGEAARVLARFLQTRTYDLGWTVFPGQLPAEGVHSKRMQQVALAALPDLEALMLQEEHDYASWQLWSTLHAWTGHRRSALDLWRRIPVAPGRDPYIPSDSLRPVIRELKGAKRWSELAAFLEPQVVRTLELLDRGFQGTEQGDFQVRDAWSVLGPLAEAHLRQGDEGSASDLVRQILAKVNDPYLVREASTLALACGRTELARQWASLQGEKSREPKALQMGK